MGVNVSRDSIAHIDVLALRVSGFHGRSRAGRRQLGRLRLLRIPATSVLAEGHCELWGVREVSFLVPWRDLKREARIRAKVSDRSVPVHCQCFVTSRWWAQQSAVPLACCFDGMSSSSSAAAASVGCKTHEAVRAPFNSAVSCQRLKLIGEGAGGRVVAGTIDESGSAGLILRGGRPALTRPRKPSVMGSEGSYHELLVPSRWRAFTRCIHW